MNRDGLDEAAERATVRLYSPAEAERLRGLVTESGRIDAAEARGYARAVAELRKWVKGRVTAVNANDNAVAALNWYVKRLGDQLDEMESK